MADIQKKRLTKEELKILIDDEIARSDSVGSSDLSVQRAKALDRYHAEPLGTEMEGRSKIHTRDVLEVIEWILPTLIRIFTSTDKAVEFVPVGPEDEQKCLQETAYINHVFYQKNNGFLILYSWFKDALLSKNGIVKAYAEEEQEVEKETYYDLLDVEFQSLMADDEYELIEHDTEIKTITMADSGQPIPVQVHNATFKRTSKNTEICIDVIAPEDFIISGDARCIDPSKARFCAQISRLTVSELREMGYSDDDIMKMEFVDYAGTTQESIARRQFYQEHDDETKNISQQTVKMYECIYKIDVDGDGISELCKVMRSGDFVEYEEIDYHPFHAITPIILTHKFYGYSVADIISDIQEQRTMLFRAYFDNVNQTINGTTYYDENRVNVDDMLTSVPFGNRAVDGTPGDAIMYIPPTGLPASVFTLNETLDKMMNERVGDFKTPLDPDVLQNAQTGVVVNALNESKSKVEMIARVFAEAGVKPLFMTLHHLARKYSSRDEVIKLRNTYVPVRPQEWHERTDMRCNVGLGTQNRAERIANLMQIYQMQLGYTQAGVPTLTPQNFYALGVEISEAMGYLPEKFFTNPQLIPPPPPQPDPNDKVIQATMQVEQMKAQVEMQKAQLTARNKEQETILKAREMEINAQNAMSKAEIERMRAQLENIRAIDSQKKAEIDLMLQNKEMMMRDAQHKMDTAVKVSESQNKALLEEYKAELNATIETLKLDPDSDKIMRLVSELMAQISDIQDKIDKDEDEDVETDEAGRITRIGKKRITRDASGKPVKISRK